MSLVSTAGEIRRWDVATGRPLGAPLSLPDISNSGSIPLYAIRRDAGAIVHTRQAAGKSEVVYLDVASGRVLGHPIELQRPAGALALTPDGKTVAITQGTAAQAVGSLQRQAAWPAARARKSYIYRIEFSPDGKTLAICGNDESRLWDVATKQPLGASMVHMQEVNAARFSPDGKSVVICCGRTLVRAVGESGEARQFDALTGRQIGPVLTHRHGVGNAVFAPMARHSPLRQARSGRRRARPDSGKRPPAGRSERRSCITAAFPAWRFDATARGSSRPARTGPPGSGMWQPRVNLAPPSCIAGPSCWRGLWAMARRL